MSTSLWCAGRALGLAVLATCAIAAVSVPAAEAATHDLFAAPAAAGSGDCSSAANACAITDAATSANALPSADSVRIELADGTYSLPTQTPTAMAITAPAPQITFAAATGASPVLDGTDTIRPLQVGAGTTVTVDGIDFENGSTTGLGGAILNDGTLTVEGATFSGNHAANGGAISSSVGSTLHVADSSFSTNVATSVGGGAIILFGTMTVVRSAFLGNTAPVNGGAINVQPNSDATVSQSTFSANTSGSLGGALSNLGTLVVQGSTIVGGTASGGAAIATGNANVTFAATIIGAQASGEACNPASTAVVDAGYNLDTDGTCISDTTPATGSHAGTSAYGSSTYADVLDAYLADAPADNGGPTETFALLNTPDPATDLANPAFDVIPASFQMPAEIGGQSAACAMADQRGVVPVPGASCAIGAYLLQATSTTLTASTAIVGQPMTWTARVDAEPDGGTVAFDDGAGNPATSQCAAQPVEDGIASCTVTYPSTGTQTATASYSGDGLLNSFAPSKSAPLAVTVDAPPPVPPTPPTPPTPPEALTLSGVSIAPRCMSASSSTLRLSYTLNRAARVTFSVQKRTSAGLVTPKRCPSPLPSGKNDAAYTAVGTGTQAAPGGAGYATVQQSGAVTRGLARAARRVTLKGTVASARGKHRISLLKTLRATTTLAPGRYRVVVDAVDAAGVKSQTATAWFWVLRPARR